MRRRYTNLVAGYRGPTVTIAVRIRPELAEFIDAHLGEPDLPNRSAVIQDAVALWCITEQERTNRNGDT